MIQRDKMDMEWEVEQSRWSELTGFTLQICAGSETIINLESKCNTNALYYTAFLTDTERWIREKYYAGTFFFEYWQLFYYQLVTRKRTVAQELNHRRKFTLRPSFSAFREEKSKQNLDI